MTRSPSSATRGLAGAEELLAELLLRNAELRLREAGEYDDPFAFADGFVNNLPAIAYALGAGMPAIEWQTAAKNPNETERVLRAIRQWSEQARMLILLLAAGALTLDQFYDQLVAAYRQQARNSYVSGRRAVGDLKALQAEDEDAIDEMIADDVARLNGLRNNVAAGGIGSLIASMILDPTNYFGSGLPGDPFAPKHADDALKQLGRYGQRMEQYGRTIGSYANRGELDAITSAFDPGASYVWWVLGNADHCIDCIRLSDLSPFNADQLNGIYPGAGYTRCGSNCACYLQYDIPSTVCADPFSGAGLADFGLGGEFVEGAEPRILVPGVDLLVPREHKVNVWVQESASCALPLSVSSLGYPGDYDPLDSEAAFSWNADMQAQIEGSLDDSELWEDVAAHLAAIYGDVARSAPDALRGAKMVHYRLPKVGSEYTAIWRDTGDALRFEVGAVTQGVPMFDVDYTMRALRDLGERAAAEGKRLEINGQFAGPGMKRWLDTIGADAVPLGSAPRIVTAIPDPIALAPSPVSAIPSTAVEAVPVPEGWLKGYTPAPNPTGGLAAGPDDVIQAGFVEAATTDEAYARLAALHVNLRSDVSAELVKMQLPQLNAILAGAERLDAFGADLGRVAMLGEFSRVPKYALRGMSTRPAVTIARQNVAFRAGARHFAAADIVGEGAHLPGMGLADTYRHEIGHVLVQNLPEDLRRDLDTIWHAHMGEVRTISDYAASSFDEWAAEAFAAITRAGYVPGTIAGDLDFWRVLERGGMVRKGSFPEVLHGIPPIDKPVVSKAASTVLPEVDALPGWPDLSRLKDVTPDAQDMLGGQSAKRIMVDPNGNQWLVKTPKNAVEIDAEVAASKLAQELGLRMPPVRVADIEGIGRVTIQPLIPDAKLIEQKVWDNAANKVFLPGGVVGALDAGQTAEMSRHAVLDFVLGNPDAHDRQWLYDAQGRLWGVDKSKAFTGATASSKQADAFFMAAIGADEPTMAGTWGDAIAGAGLIKLFDKLDPADIGRVLDRLDAIDDARFASMIGDAVNAVAEPFGTAETKLATLLERKHNARDSFGKLYRTIAGQQKPGSLPPRWQTWLDAGGKFTPSPVEVAAAVPLPPLAPIEVPLGTARIAGAATEKGAGIAGNNRAVWQAAFEPAKTKAAARQRLFGILSGAPDSAAVDGFGLEQLNAILARAEHLRDRGVDLGHITSLADYRAIPAETAAQGIGLTLGDRIALDHRFRWQAIDPSAHPTAYDDIGGLFAHEAGHTVWNGLGVDARDRMLELYRAHVDDAGKISEYATQSVDEWFGEVFAAITQPGYQHGAISFDDELWGILAADGKVRAVERGLIAQPPPFRVPELKLKPVDAKKPKMGGLSTKAVYTDATGRDWLIKPKKVFADDVAKSRAAIDLEQAVAPLGDLVGVNVAPVATHTIEFPWVAGEDLRTMGVSAQPLIPGIQHMPLTPDGKVAFEQLTDDQLNDLMGQQVFDWLVGNDDGHIGQFLIGPDGKLVGIDKDAAFWEVASQYALGNSTPEDGLHIAHTVWDGMTTERLARISPERIGRILDRVDAITPDEYARYLDPHLPILEAHPNGVKVSAEQRRAWIMQRKAELRADFDGYYRRQLAALKEQGVALPDNWAAWEKAGARFAEATPHALPTVRNLSEKMVAKARAEAQAVRKTVEDVVAGKVDAAISWTASHSVYAVDHNLPFRKIGGLRIYAKDTATLDRLSAYLAEPGHATTDDALWKMLGYSDTDLRKLKRYEELKRPAYPKAEVGATLTPQPLPAKAWFEPGDTTVYTVPGHPTPLNVEPKAWSGAVPDEPPLPPGVKPTTAQIDAARAAADKVRITVDDVISGKRKVAWSWRESDVKAAKDAGLVYAKVGNARLIARSDADLEPFRKYLAAAGHGAGDDEFWHLLGYSDRALDTIDKADDIAKGKRLTAGVMIVEPDGRVWVMAPRNKWAGYENTVIKGGVDPGESIAEGAVREAREEAGFSVELDGYLGDYENTDHTSITRMYIAHRTGGGPRFAKVKETYQARLVTPEEAKQLLTRYGKPDARDQQILADTIAALDAKPGLVDYAVPAGSVDELATKLTPSSAAPPLPEVPRSKKVQFGAAPIAPEPVPPATAFHYDGEQVKALAANATESPPADKFPYYGTRYQMPSGETATMYWRYQSLPGPAVPVATGPDAVAVAHVDDAIAKVNKGTHGSTFDDEDFWLLADELPGDGPPRSGITLLTEAPDGTTMRMFGWYGEDGQIASAIAAGLDDAGDINEIKLISTLEEYQGKGYATALADWIQGEGYDLIGTLPKTVGFTDQGRAFSLKWLEHRKKLLLEGKASPLADAYRVPSPDEVQLLASKIDAIQPKFSPAQKAALDEYASNNLPNDYLRSGKAEFTFGAGPITPAQQQLAEQQITRLDSIADSTKLDEPMVVWRGVGTDSPVYKKPTVGDFVSDPGYQSTSVDPVTAGIFTGTGDGEGVLYRISLPAGEHGVWVGDVVDQKEWLIPRDRALKVTKVTEHATIPGVDGKVTLVELVPEEAATAAPQKRLFWANSKKQVSDPIERWQAHVAQVTRMADTAAADPGIVAMRINEDLLAGQPELRELIIAGGGHPEGKFVEIDREHLIDLGDSIKSGTALPETQVPGPTGAIHPTAQVAAGTPEVPLSMDGMNHLLEHAQVDWGVDWTDTTIVQWKIGEATKRTVTHYAHDNVLEVSPGQLTNLFAQEKQEIVAAHLYAVADPLWQQTEINLVKLTGPSALDADLDKLWKSIGGELQDGQLTISVSDLHKWSDQMKAQLTAAHYEPLNPMLTFEGGLLHGAGPDAGLIPPISEVTPGPAALYAPEPVPPGIYDAPAVSSAVHAADSSALVKAIENATDTKTSVLGFPAIHTDFSGPGSYDFGEVWWRRLGNVLEAHEVKADEPTIRAYISRMAKAMDDAPKISGLRFTTAATGQLDAASRDLLTAAGAKAYPGGLKLTREQTMALRDQIEADAYFAAAHTAQGAASAYGDAAGLLVDITPQKQGFTKYVWSGPSTSDVTIRQRMLSKQIVWSNVAATDSSSAVNAAVRQLQLNAEQLKANPALAGIRFDATSQLPLPVVDLLEGYGGVTTDGVLNIGREQALKLADELSGEMGIAIPVATPAPAAAVSPGLSTVLGGSPVDHYLLDLVGDAPYGASHYTVQLAAGEPIVADMTVGLGNEITIYNIQPYGFDDGPAAAGLASYLADLNGKVSINNAVFGKLGLEGQSFKQALLDAGATLNDGYVKLDPDLTKAVAAALKADLPIVKPAPSLEVVQNVTPVTAEVKLSAQLDFDHAVYTNADVLQSPHGGTVTQGGIDVGQVGGDHVHAEWLTDTIADGSNTPVIWVGLTTYTAPAEQQIPLTLKALSTVGDNLAEYPGYGGIVIPAYGASNPNGLIDLLKAAGGTDVYAADGEAVVYLTRGKLKRLVAQIDDNAPVAPPLVGSAAISPPLPTTPDPVALLGLDEEYGKQLGAYVDAYKLTPGATGIKATQFDSGGEIGWVIDPPGGEVRVVVNIAGHVGDPSMALRQQFVAQIRATDDAIAALPELAKVRVESQVHSTASIGELLKGFGATESDAGGLLMSAADWHTMRAAVDDVLGLSPPLNAAAVPTSMAQLGGWTKSGKQAWQTTENAMHFTNETVQQFTLSLGSDIKLKATVVSDGGSSLSLNKLESIGAITPTPKQWAGAYGYVLENMAATAGSNAQALIISKSIIDHQPSLKAVLESVPGGAKTPFGSFVVAPESTGDLAAAIITDTVPLGGAAATAAPTPEEVEQALGAFRGHVPTAATPAPAPSSLGQLYGVNASKFNTIGYEFTQQAQNFGKFEFTDGATVKVRITSSTYRVVGSAGLDETSAWKLFSEIEPFAADVHFAAPALQQLPAKSRDLLLTLGGKVPGADGSLRFTADEWKAFRDKLIPTAPAPAVAAAAVEPPIVPLEQLLHGTPPNAPMTLIAKHGIDESLLENLTPHVPYSQPGHQWVTTFDDQGAILAGAPVYAQSGELTQKISVYSKHYANRLGLWKVGASGTLDQRERAAVKRLRMLLDQGAKENKNVFVSGMATREMPGLKGILDDIGVVKKDIKTGNLGSIYEIEKANLTKAMDMLDGAIPPPGALPSPGAVIPPLGVEPPLTVKVSLFTKSGIDEHILGNLDTTAGYSLPGKAYFNRYTDNAAVEAGAVFYGNNVLSQHLEVYSKLYTHRAGLTKVNPFGTVEQRAAAATRRIGELLDYGVANDTAVFVSGEVTRELAPIKKLVDDLGAVKKDLKVGNLGVVYEIDKAEVQKALDLFKANEVTVTVPSPAVAAVPPPPVVPPAATFTPPPLEVPPPGLGELYGYDAVGLKNLVADAQLPTGPALVHTEVSATPLTQVFEDHWAPIGKRVRYAEEQQGQARILKVRDIVVDSTTVGTPQQALLASFQTSISLHLADHPDVARVLVTKKALDKTPPSLAQMFSDAGWKETKDYWVIGRDDFGKFVLDTGEDKATWQATSIIGDAATPSPTAAAVPGPAAAPLPTAPAQGVASPAFIYDYDRTGVQANLPKLVDTVRTDPTLQAGAVGHALVVDGIEARWSISPSGKTVGWSELITPPGVTPAQKADAAFAQMRYIAAQAEGRDGFFWIKPEVYDQVPGLRQMLIDAGGNETAYAKLGTAVQMKASDAKNLVSAIDTNTMTGLTVSAKTASDYLGFDPAAVKALTTQAPTITARQHVWKVANKDVKLAVRSEGNIGGGIRLTGWSGTPQPAAAMAELAWASEIGLTRVVWERAALEGVPKLDKFLLAVGAKVDGDTLVLDAAAINSARKIIGHDALPLILGGEAMPYSVLDDLNASIDHVIAAAHSELQTSAQLSTRTSFKIGENTVSTTWKKSDTSIYWETLRRDSKMDPAGNPISEATIGNQRNAAAAQLRSFLNSMAQDASLTRLDIDQAVLAQVPALRDILLRYGATDVTPTAGTPFLSIERVKAAKLRKELEAELAQVVTPGANTSYISQQVALIKWPDASELKVSSSSLARKVVSEGQTRKHVLVDADGNEWLFKPGASGRGAVTDRAVAQLAEMLGLPVPPARVYTVNIDGKPVSGSLAKLIPGAKSMQAAGTPSPAALNAVQTEDMFRHSILDWLTNNDDAHVGNWMADADGHLWAIDKSRSWVTFGGSHDVLNTASEGNGGGTPWMFLWWRQARQDPKLLEKLHPSTFSTTLRKLVAVDDDTFRRLVDPVARAKAADARTAGKYLNKPDQLIADMLKRKNAVVSDFERYVAGELKTIKAQGGAIPLEWDQWLTTGKAQFNLNATPKDLWIERKAYLDAKWGDYDPRKAKQLMDGQAYSRLRTAITQYFGGGYHGAGFQQGYGAETIRKTLTEHGLGQAVADWQELQEWSFLNIVNGRASVNPQWDENIRKWWNADNGTLRVVRTTNRYGTDPKRYVDEYSKSGMRDMIGTAVGKTVTVAGGGGVILYLEVPWHKVFSQYVMGFGHGTLGGEAEYLIHSPTVADIRAIRRAGDSMSTTEWLHYDGPPVIEQK